jgi:hypothetical protein
MAIDWKQFNQALIPIKNYQDLCQRWQISFSYPFVRQAYCLDMPALVAYTHRILGGDARQRYTAYEACLNRTFLSLHQAGVQDTLHLLAHLDPSEQLEALVEKSGLPSEDLAAVLKYLTYWFIPMEKYLSTLVQEDPAISAAVQALRGLGIRTNLDMLQQGLTPSARQALAETSGLPEAVICGLVNRADFSRLPWASKATISNLIGAGYGSLARLAAANPEQLYADFYAYGQAIGKNLKLGNEIENSYRIASLLPAVLKDDQPG